MPLTACPDCRTAVATSAAACPKCARPGPFAPGVATRGRGRLRRVLTGAGILGAGFVALLVIASRQPDSGRADWERIKTAKRAVSAKLNDPSSAEWGPAVVHGNAVCFSVNSRNRLGGMAGPQPVIVVGDTDVQFFGDAGFQPVWDANCR